MLKLASNFFRCFLFFTFVLNCCGECIFKRRKWWTFDSFPNSTCTALWLFNFLGSHLLLLIALEIPSIFSLKPPFKFIFMHQHFFCERMHTAERENIKIDHQQYVEILEGDLLDAIHHFQMHCWSIKSIGHWFWRFSLSFFSCSLVQFIEKDNAPSACSTNPNGPNPFGFFHSMFL